MVLTNAERQARYRERLKQLAVRGVMTDFQTRSLADLRHRLREWRGSLASMTAGRMRLTTNGVDTTAEHVEMVKRLIALNYEVLARFDPQGLTADGKVEIGEVSAREYGGILPDRWVSYSLDEQGRAANLRLYETESLARTDAAMAPGRRVGVIADDMWSISPSTE